MFFNQFDNQRKGYEAPKQQQKQSYQNNYFQNEKPKQQNPSQNFNPFDFFKQENVNKKDTRADGNKTTYADMDGTKNTSWKKTSYSTQEGLTTTATGINVTNNPNVKLNGNSYQWKDSEYGYVDIYAMNIAQLKNSAKNGVYTSPYYGSIIEVEDSNGNISYGAILDACGQASKTAILDKFTKNTEPNNEYISWTVKRKGFANKDDDPRWK